MNTIAGLALDIVIPVHNEEAAVVQYLPRLIEDYERSLGDVRFVVVENGSTDGTWERLQELAAGRSLLAIRSPVADYGAALRAGVLAADRDYLMLAEIDFCEMDFAVEALRLVAEGGGLAQSSKACAGAVDRRALIRRFITRSYNATLRALFGFRGTDTHGMKLAERRVIQELLDECVLDGDLLATEMVLRAERHGIPVREIAMTIEERRATSISISRRVPSTIRDLVRLAKALRRA